MDMLIMLFSDISFEVWLLIFDVILPLVFLAIFLPIKITNNQYKKFVLEHSIAIRKLKAINKKYNYESVPNLDLMHSYDNANFYKDISCRDYLTYQLAYSRRKHLSKCKKLVNERNATLIQYNSEVAASSIVMDKYDVPVTLENHERLKRVEKAVYKATLAKPIRSFSMTIQLELTNMNGKYIESKAEKFGSRDISNIISRLKNKRGDFYLDKGIWESLCRVERGKVTNKMRFAIYQRDNNRCRMCGRRTGDLEIDHIIPIAKGGKTTYENLQTLCHRCNVKKGSKIIY